MFFFVIKKKEKKKTTPSGRLGNFDDSRGFPLAGLRMLTIPVLFPTEASECGGGIVSCQKDPGILCVSTEYSEDSVGREGRYSAAIVSQPATHTWC